MGKSTLLAQITRGTDADVRVIGLIGERGREVREFLEENLGAEGMAHTVVVVATSDEPPLVRLKAAFVATRIAEAFRDEGRDVLLLMDSITRTAMAQREVGPLRRRAAGDPGLPAQRVRHDAASCWRRPAPARRARSPGLYTVLVEGDDHNEPIADTARSILDGHIVLTRALATAGHFPAIDVLESISRVADAVIPPEHMADARETRRLMGALRDVKELIEIGAYQTGSDPLVDRARQLGPLIEGFLRQPTSDKSSPDQAWQHAAAGRECRVKRAAFRLQPVLRIRRDAGADRGRGRRPGQGGVVGCRTGRRASWGWPPVAWRCARLHRRLSSWPIVLRGDRWPPMPRRRGGRSASRRGVRRGRPGVDGGCSADEGLEKLNERHPERSTMPLAAEERPSTTSSPAPGPYPARGTSVT